MQVLSVLHKYATAEHYHDIQRTVYHQLWIIHQDLLVIYRYIYFFIASVTLVNTHFGWHNIYFLGLFISFVTIANSCMLMHTHTHTHLHTHTNTHTHPPHTHTHMHTVTIQPIQSHSSIYPPPHTTPPSPDTH